MQGEFKGFRGFGTMKQKLRNPLSAHKVLQGTRHHEAQHFEKENQIALARSVCPKKTVTSPTSIFAGLCGLTDLKPFSSILFSRILPEDRSFPWQSPSKGFSSIFHRLSLQFFCKSFRQRSRVLGTVMGLGHSLHSL